MAQDRRGAPRKVGYISFRIWTLYAAHNRAAIIYYMLKDDVETSVIQKIIHYVCKPTKEYKGANPSDTIYTYVAHPEKSFLDKADRIDYIKETLKKYHFDEEYINKNIK